MIFNVSKRFETLKIRSIDLLVLNFNVQFLVHNELKACCYDTRTKSCISIIFIKL